MEGKDDDLIQRICKKILQFRLEIPAIVLFESMKPLSFVASQLLVFFDPFVQTIFSFKDYQRFYRMLENRENIEKIIQTLEQKRGVKGEEP